MNVPVKTLKIRIDERDLGDFLCEMGTLVEKKISAEEGDGGNRQDEDKKKAFLLNDRPVEGMGDY